MSPCASGLETPLLRWGSRPPFRGVAPVGVVVTCMRRSIPPYQRDMVLHAVPSVACASGAEIPLLRWGSRPPFRGIAPVGVVVTCMRGSIRPYPMDMMLHAIPPIPCVPGPEPPPPGVRYLRPCPRYHLPDGSDGWCNRYNACLTCVSAEMNKRCVISPRPVSDTSPRYGTRYLLRPDACGCVALHS